NDALKKLGAKAVQMGELGLYNANLGSWLWSSSEGSESGAWCFATDYRDVNGINKKSSAGNCRVRAFCAL
ncbi:MAG: hypothetical protein KBT34_10790, partial [Prevotella sp.]|nr:hypothetical protein [Candidatus Prevotella equi]